jgi:hypothetical protein
VCSSSTPLSANIVNQDTSIIVAGECVAIENYAPDPGLGVGLGVKLGVGVGLSDSPRAPVHRPDNDCVLVLTCDTGPAVAFIDTVTNLESEVGTRLSNPSHERTTTTLVRQNAC